MMKILSLFFTFFLCTYLSAQENLISIDSLHILYKKSTIISTGIVTSIYKGDEWGKTQIVEFELTEIQKGKDYNQLMIYAAKEKWNFEMGKEYVVFANKQKLKSPFYLLYSEEVCKQCDNRAIKEVYNLVDRNPFASIKKPHSKKTWMDRGCGCH